MSNEVTLIVKEAGEVVVLSNVLVGLPGRAGADDWSQIQNKPATFPPSSHTHTSAQITDFATAVAQVSPPTTWANIPGKPATFPPNAHTHTAVEITDFASAVVAAAPPTTDASLLTTGTLADARLSAQVTASLALANTASQPGHGHTIGDVSGLQFALNAEAQTRAEADTGLGERIDFIAANLDPEQLDSIAEAVTTINTERSERIAADTVLDGKITAETTARTTALATKANTADLSGTAYKLITKSETITANWPYIGDSLGSGEGRAIDWKINFTAPRTVDFLFNINPSGITGVIPPVLGDYVNVTLSGTASPWTANFKRADGTILLAVTSADTDLKKTNLRFVYDGTAWGIDRTVWNPALQSALDAKQPTGSYVTRTDVQSGGSSYFERSADAASQNVGQGQSVHQLVLANDTRLTDPRRVQWFPAPPNFYTVPNGATAGAMAYDGSFIYILVPTPVGQSLRWARTPLSMTW